LNDPRLSPAQKNARYEQLERRDDLKKLIVNKLYYAACGMMLAVALAVAEPLTTRNYQEAVMNSAVGAVLGLLGGIIFSFVADWLVTALAGGGGEAGLGRHMAARSVSFGVLGLFLTVAPGLIMKNPRKLLAGLIGGLIGG